MGQPDVLARIPWIDRVWALPFMTVLAPSERSYQGQDRRPPSWLDRARQMVRLGRHWVPSRELVVVGDSTDAALEWLDAVRERACVITRLRLDAALYTPAPPRKPKQNGRPRKKGRRLPTLTHVVAAPTTPWQLVTVAPRPGIARKHVRGTSPPPQPSGIIPVYRRCRFGESSSAIQPENWRPKRYCRRNSSLSLCRS